jgi:NTP pyrophosphatase (non-canonical NTP hydrolase)
VSTGDDRLAALQGRLRAFVASREWEHHHDPKNLAMAIAGEAGELAAELQWLTTEQARTLVEPVRGRVVDEAADVLIYLLHLAAHLEVDLVDAALAKMDRNEVRYPPVERSPS